jgi:hypothetical protein
MRAGLGNVPRVVPSAHRKPFWLIPNLLSLDAPLVAVAWLYIFAKTWRADYIPWVAYISLGLVVWVIYVTDRLLDASMRDGSSARMEARHQFHRKHQKIFGVLAVVAGITAVTLIVSGLPVNIYSYGIIGGIMVAGFFTLSIFSPPGENELPHAKNILAGLAFAYGTALLAHAYTGFEMRTILSRELICFGVLCILNISAVDLWEQANRSSDPEIKAGNELALTLPLALLGGSSLIFALKAQEYTTRPFFYAILTSAALLHILNRSRARFQMDSLRVLADVALLAPLVVFHALTGA